MQNDYCTEHFDTTGWVFFFFVFFLVISLARSDIYKEKTKTHVLQIFNRNRRNTFLYFFPQVRVAEGEHSPEQIRGAAARPPTARSVRTYTLKQLRPLEDNVSLIYRVPTQVCKVLKSLDF